ncbi:hypothetical protein Plhal304r1_c009g0035971 [Plasmopara halstedii]
MLEQKLGTLHQAIMNSEYPPVSPDFELVKHILLLTGRVDVMNVKTRKTVSLGIKRLNR